MHMCVLALGLCMFYVSYKKRFSPSHIASSDIVQDRHTDTDCAYPDSAAAQHGHCTFLHHTGLVSAWNMTEVHVAKEE